MSIFYREYKDELWKTANSSGNTGIVGFSDEMYAVIQIYWQIGRKSDLNVYDEIDLPITDNIDIEYQKRQIDRIQYIMTCPIEDVPMYINDTLLMHIAKKRLEKGM
jgi:hypothetical protein